MTRLVVGAISAPLVFVPTKHGTPDHPPALDAPLGKPVRKPHVAKPIPRRTQQLSLLGDAA